MPTSVNCFRRGTTPAGVTWPPGATIVTLSPVRAPSCARQFDAEHDVPLAGAQLRQQGLPRARQLGDLGLGAGVDAAHDGAAQFVAAAHQRLRGDEGRGTDDALVAPRRRGRGAPVGQRRRPRRRRPRCAR